VSDSDPNFSNMIKNYIQNNELPIRKPIPLDSLYFGLNSFYITIFHIWFSFSIQNKFLNERISVTCESIDDERSIVKLSNKEEYELNRKMIRDFTDELKEESKFYWHFLQKPLKGTNTCLESIMVLLFLKYHDWLQIRTKNLFIEIEWTKIPPFRQKGRMQLNTKN